MVNYLRQALPYIHEHRNKTIMVLLHESIVSNLTINRLVHDWALLQNLGIRLIIVPWCEALDAKAPLSQAQHQAIKHNIDALWNQIHQQCTQHNVLITQGNFATARPEGVLNGEDLAYRGLVKQVHIRPINQLLNIEQLIWASPLAYSKRGDPLLIRADQWAIELANQLAVHKLFVFADQAILPNISSRQRHISELQSEEHPLFALAKQATHSANSLERLYLLNGDVDGAMLMELYTRDGCGLLLYADHYDVIRQATPDDIPHILQLTNAYQQQQTLVNRSSNEIAQHIDQYYLMLRDHIAVGCCRLNDWGGDCCEIASLAIAKDAKGLKLGVHLLQRIETLARNTQKQQLFALSTQAVDWFLDQGFELQDVTSLPMNVQSNYNQARQSKVLCKLLK